MQNEYLYLSGERTFLFGLHWQPVVGHISTQQARQVCKYKKAKGWVIAGQTFFSIGLTNQRLKVKKNIYVAAVCYATLYPRGLHAAIYKIDDTHFWLIAVQEGTPIQQSDKLYPNSHEAQTALFLLAEKYAQMNYVSDALPLSNLLGSLAPRSIPKALIQSYTTKRWQILAVLIMLLGGVYVYGWQWRVPAVEAAVVEPEIDPYLQHWNNQSISAHNHAALHSLLTHWHHMPLYLAQWRLDQIECVALTKKWQCQHSYTPLTAMATVMDFERVLPDLWAITDVSLQKITVKSVAEIELSAQPIWRSKEKVNLQLLSQLQHIRSAFTNLKITEPQSLLSRAPVLTNPSFSAIFSQKLYFQGPLRSLVLLSDFDDALYWKKASLKYIPQAKPSLKNSMLQADLQGVIYVRD